MVEKKNTEYVEGSTVLAPGRYEPKIKEAEYDKLRKAQIERANRLKLKKNIKRRMALKGVAAVFILGFALMSNEARVYNKQQQLTKINQEISNASKDSENIKLQLVKLDSLEDIKNTADKKLHMVMPDKTKVVYVDFTKNNFSEKPSDDKKSEISGILEEIKNLLF